MRWWIDAQVDGRIARRVPARAGFAWGFTHERGHIGDCRGVVRW